MSAHLSPTYYRLGGFALSLTVFGAGFSFAQDRRSSSRPAADRPTMQRPTVERPMLDRPTVQRPTVERPAVGRPNVDRPAVQRPTVERPIRPASNDIIVPRPMPRCMERPTPNYWRHRDIMAEIQAMARRGFIAVHPIGEDIKEFAGFSDYPAGWIAYGFRVPAGESIHVRLRHSNEGWFRLAMMNKWGSLEQGMLQNLIPTGNPEVKYTNPTKEARSVYVLVDDPGWMSTQANPFTVGVTRSWDPAKLKVNDAPIVTGIWAQKKEEKKPAETKPLETQEAEPKVKS